LESLHKVDHVMFDKTGTLTEGNMRVVQLAWREKAKPDLLPHVLEAENGSFHPIAHAVRVFLHSNNVSISTTAISDRVVKDLPGSGRMLLCEGGTFFTGSASLFSDPFKPQHLKPYHTLVWFGFEGEAEGCFLITDQIRDGTVETVNHLQRDGYQLELLSGDRGDVCSWIGSELHFKSWQGDLTMEDKVSMVKSREKEGRTSVFVGDGTNDALAMNTAPVSIALAKSTDEALAASGFILLKGDPRQLLELFRTGRKLGKIIRLNYFWAFLYNTLFIPVAASGRLTPLMAMLLMLVSSTSVLINSLRIKRQGH